MGAKAYVLNLSENVKRSLEYKRRNGEWGGKAPLGYLNVRDANNKSTLVHDPERAFLVKMLFEDYAKGCFSISGDLVQKAREWRLRNKTRKGGQLSASQIQHILMNPFYYGAMRVKDKLYPHTYPPLIGQELFDRCETVRLGKTRQTATRYSEKAFIFRGLVECAVSGRTVTCDVKKGRHVYLICRNPADPQKKLFLPESAVLDQVKVVLRSIQVPPKLLSALLAHMRASHEAENQFHRDAIATLRREYDQTRDKLTVLLDMRLDKNYAGRVRQKSARTEGAADRDRATDRAASARRGRLPDDLGRADFRGFSRCRDLRAFEQKRELIAFVFSNLRLRGKKLEFSLRSPFDLMVNRADYTSWLAFLDTHPLRAGNGQISCRLPQTRRICVYRRGMVRGWVLDNPPSTAKAWPLT